jgi:y4mF family transcriptional regulator
MSKLSPIGYNLDNRELFYTLSVIIMNLAEFTKEKRKLVKLTQVELSEKAGVGLRFIRELEQGKETLRLDKVNQVLSLFGYELAPVNRKRVLGNEKS